MASRVLFPTLKRAYFNLVGSVVYHHQPFLSGSYSSWLSMKIFNDECNVPWCIFRNKFSTMQTIEGLEQSWKIYLTPGWKSSLEQNWKNNGLEQDSWERCELVYPVQCSSVLKKRRKKMNRHKYRKWRKRMRFKRRALNK